MFDNRIFNFSAGPATLPVEVLERIKDEVINYKGSGMSVMEMSHRSKEFTEIIETAEQRLRDLMNIPNDYSVLFLQGGASLQFAMVPLNLYLQDKPVDMMNTGSWTKKAIAEHKKLTKYNIVATSEEANFLKLPNVDKIEFNSGASYVYMCSNNTIFGTQFKKFPQTGNVPLVCDMSSEILSREIDVSKFGLIFAGAQKNLGPSGVTIVIMKNDLAERASKDLPTMMQYRTHIDAKSLYNTPPTFTIYIVGLVLEWLEKQGGVNAMSQINDDKAKLLYDTIDQNDFFYCPVPQEDRSPMNVVFRITGDKEDLEKQFVDEATKAGLSNLKGHRSVGGLRASIYNAHPRAGVEALVQFMNEFSQKQG